MASPIVANLLTKEMDRKEFLKHAGIAAIALTGVSALLGTLTNFGKTSISHGYGGSVYGGAERK